MAIFRTEFGFKITGRGFVIAGDIIEGTISSGDWILTSEIEPLNGKVIKSVEFVGNLRTGTAKIGLMIPWQSDAELEKLQGLDLQQKQIEIKE
jgi:translation elongation factor EF-Tu-like GTPase